MPSGRAPGESSSARVSAGSTTGALAIPSPSLPKGGGAIRGIGEKLSVNPLTGTGSLTVPLAISNNRCGFSPQLALSYDSGAGNGPFGLGWSVATPAISRKTEKSLPRYRDGEDSDAFLLSGAEELVPTLKESPQGWIRDRFETDGFSVQRFRPRVEGLFARLERWRDRLTGETHWRSVTRDNISAFYGRTAAARIADPRDPSRVFQWLLDESRDDRGNILQYEYKAEDAEGVDRRAPHEWNRVFTNRYLKRVLYGNQVPFQPGDWHFELVFDYGEHDDNEPTPEAKRSWPARPDPFSSYRAGFEVRTFRLCRRVLMFHRFAELTPSPCLVRSTDLTYTETASFSFMSAVRQTGYVHSAAGYQKKSLPPLTFGYTEALFDEDVQSLEGDALEHLPAGLQGRQWVDLDGEGLSGILFSEGGSWRYKRNLGDGRFTPSQQVAEQPVAAGEPGVRLMDLAGDGRIDLVLLQPGAAGFYERSDEGWSSFRRFRELPTFNWSDPQLRLLDLDGDGRSDALITEHEVLRWYPGLGEEGFASSETIPKARDEDEGPALVFADPAESVYLADMSGDGLQDIVRIRAASICYWPNLGYGCFGAKVTMTDAPVFDAPDQFDPRRLHLVDIDGSGPTDIVYASREGVRCWSNLSGNSWGAARVLTGLPAGDDLTDLAALDLLGNGTVCLVWSSAAPGDRTRPLRYLDLTGGVKPHLLSSVVNNLGAETRIQYAPSTRFYIADELAGEPWLTRLPFPVHVVERTEMFDHITALRFVSSYRYRHGHFDGEEREFRGFARVDQLDTETHAAFQGAGLFPPGSNALPDERLHTPPVLTRTWYHTGVWIDAEKTSSHFIGEYFEDAHAQAAPLADTLLPPGLSTTEQRGACRALKGQVLRSETYALDGSDKEGHPYAVSERSYGVRRVQPASASAHAVFFVMPSQTVELHYERNAVDPRASHQIALEIDAFGQVRKSISIGYARRAPAFAEQATTEALYTETDVVHLTDTVDGYRLGLHVETRQYELRLDAPASGRYLPGALITALDTLLESPYESAPAPNTKRAVERTRTLYYTDDLVGPLPLGLGTVRAIPYETYTIAFTSGLLEEVYGDRVTPQLLTDEGKYILWDGLYWAPSGRIEVSPARFNLPVRFVDPFGNAVRVHYDDYSLFVIKVESSEDPSLTNIVETRTDYRTLAPFLIVDANGNRSAVRFDELGLVIAAATMGKEGLGEGDTLDDPTTRMEYDLARWMTSGGPSVVHTFARERHGAENPRWQEAYSYSDGFGRVLQTKMQAEPGMAPARDAAGDLVRDANGHLVWVHTDARWIGNGRTVFNNKGFPVKQYEPFFSSTFAYEEEADLVETGVTPLLHYDPMGRLVRSDFPNGAFSRTAFDAWRQETWDANDTVLESAWYVERGAPDPGGPEPVPQEARAAWLAAHHANTPSVTHLDSLGRAFLTMQDNGPAGTLETRTTLDIEANPLQVADALGRVVATYRYDMIGRTLHKVSMDAGERRTLFDVANKPLRTWDSRGHMSRMTYDLLQRPTGLYVQSGDGPEILAERTVYGEGAANASGLNLRGRVLELYDASGVQVNERFDVDGTLVRHHRRFAVGYAEALDWLGSPALHATEYVSETENDALGRPVRLVSPDQTELRPRFNEANLLEELSARLRGASDEREFVLGVEYNAKGQRTRIEYANDVQTEFTHDPLAFRLIRVTTTRASDGRILQDLHYTYDPVGNVVEVRDQAQSDVFFNNAVVSADAKYLYDAVYRVVQAEGREHIGSISPAPVDHDDHPRMGLAHPHDGQALRRYRELYAYDAAGNVLELTHQANGGSWTRPYHYTEASNRLLATALPGDPDGVFSATYDHDPHGNMTRMPHLADMQWDFKDRLRRVDLGGGGTAYYVYGADGGRRRKVIERPGGLVEERVYIGAFEVFRRSQGNAILERETLLISDDKRRIAIVDTLTRDAGQEVASPAPIVRFQMENHLGSASLELDEDGQVVSYEEYYPYGSTSYQAGPSAAEVSLKRFRYTGKERDDETGLYYCGARYLASWLGRWTAADPAGLVDGLNLYAYARSNPITFTDPTGTQCASGKVPWYEIPVDLSCQIVQRIDNNPDYGVVDLTADTLAIGLAGTFYVAAELQGGVNTTNAPSSEDVAAGKTQNSLTEGEILVNSTVANASGGAGNLVRKKVGGGVLGLVVGGGAAGGLEGVGATASRDIGKGEVSSPEEYINNALVGVGIGMAFGLLFGLVSPSARAKGSPDAPTPDAKGKPKPKANAQPKPKPKPKAEPTEHASSPEAKAPDAAKAATADPPAKPPDAPPPSTATPDAPKSTMSDRAVYQSHATYLNAVKEIDYWRAGKAELPFRKGNAMEKDLFLSLESTPATQGQLLHLGGPNKPDFVPNTPDGLNYDFVDNLNYDIFPLSDANRWKHFNDRPYGFTMEGIFYLNPPGMRRPWLSLPIPNF